MIFCLSGCKHASWQQLYDDAHVQLQQGYYDKAIAEASDGYDQTKKDLLWNWKFRILEAEALMRNYQYKESTDLLAESPPSSLPVEIRAHKQIIQGQALCRFDRRTDGEAILNKAEELVPVTSQSLQAELAFARGYCAFPSPSTAQQYLQKSADLARTTDPFLAASALGNIGFLLNNQGRQDEAIEWFQKVVPLAQTAKSQLLEEKTLGNMGVSYSDLGDFKRAVEILEQAQRIASEIGRSEDEESWLVSLGRSYASVPGVYPGKAEPSYLRALSIANKLHDTSTSNLCLHDLAQLALNEHNLNKAKTYWQQEAAGISPGSAAEVDAWLDEAQIASAENNLDKAKKLLVHIDQDPRTNPSRHAFVQEQMGKLYWTEKNTAAADHMFQQGIHTVEDELSKIKEQYRVSFLDQHSHRFDSYIRFLMAQGRPTDALKEAERLRELAQDSHFNGKAKLNVAAIQSQLKGRNQLILDYHVTDEESFLWLITENRFQWFKLPSHRELYELIDRYSKAIQDQRPIEDSTAGQELYKALIQPAAKFIPKGTRVSIVPSKILWLLNFETLVVPGDNARYWIEDVVIQNSSSLARASKFNTTLGRNQKDLLLMGAPEEVNPAYPTLQYASDEIGRIKDHFQPMREQVISGADATPQAYKTSNPQQYRFIHFVTHGIPNERVPMESAIVLSGTDNSYKLYARDIITTPLRADLVTISACYGAGKRWYVSEGMVGLGWAFMRAGAHQVIAALWEVDDASTPELMDDFYRELARHRVTADALRNAKLKMLHSESRRRLPYFWGSLQLYIGS